MSDIDNQLADEIYRVLIGYKCAFTQIEDDGGAMPLVDLLSPGKTIAEGREECSELAAEIAEAVSRHFAGLADGWRDIATAPKDGTPILVYCPFQSPNCVVVKWRDVRQGWVNASSFGLITSEPTHWMPLPPPPKEADHD